jgi:hypothetical protein
MRPLLFYLTVVAALEPEWREVTVRYSIQGDGTVQMVEWVDVEVPPEVTAVERNYWSDDEQSVVFTRVVRSISDDEGMMVDFESPRAGTVRWNVLPGKHRYVIVATVAGAVIPSWGIPRGRELRREEKREIGRPIDRLRAALPLWRDASPSRYLLDTQFNLPPRSTTGTSVQLQLDWTKDWSPVNRLRGDTIGEAVDLDGMDAYRILHLFQAAGRMPSTIDLRAHAIRSGAVAGFPVVALLFWIVFTIREIRRYGGEVSVVNEQFIRDKIFSEPPEVIAAQWSAEVWTLRLETFLRQLEKQRKIALRIERIGEGEDEDVKVNVRLLVSREQLTPYERAGIDALIPEGMETSTDEIRRRYAGQEEGEFDPTDALHDALAKIAQESHGPDKPAWSSQLLSVLLFWGGLTMVTVGLLQANRGRDPIFATVIAAVILSAFWPSKLLRRVIRQSRRAVALLLIGIVLTFAALLYIDLLSDLPMPPLAAAGAALVMLATYKTMLAGATGRESAEALRRQKELVHARDWLRAAPNLLPDAEPWLAALALRPRKPKSSKEEEDWGWALMA